MFGMGFMEIFLILVVAIIALGPEKLPTAAVDMAKFFKKIKGGIDDAKSTIDSELNLSELQDDVSTLKSQMNLDKLSSIDFDDPFEEDISKKTKKQKNKKISKNKEEKV
jgi:sec-independent protein translocase protein TatB